jgi:phosphinothricin acetyltransferase
MQPVTKSATAEQYYAAADQRGVQSITHRSMSSEINIRPASENDLAALIGIYNHYVSHSHCTFDTEPFDLDSRQPWWQQFDGQRYQCWVAESQRGIAGYACTSPFKAKPAYGTSVEISVYVHPQAGRQGIGRRLYDALLPALATHNVHRAYAGIALPNDASIGLHEQFGFRQAAHFREVGYKFERFWDVVWLERAIG